MEPSGWARAEDVAAKGESAVELMLLTLLASLGPACSGADTCPWAPAAAGEVALEGCGVGPLAMLSEEPLGVAWRGGTLSLTMTCSGWCRSRCQVLNRRQPCA
jgi:hypothetical protein